MGWQVIGGRGRVGKEGWGYWHYGGNRLSEVEVCS